MAYPAGYVPLNYDLSSKIAKVEDPDVREILAQLQQEINQMYNIMRITQNRVMLPYALLDNKSEF